MADKTNVRSLKHLSQEELRLMLTNAIRLAWVHPIDAINKLENGKNKSGKLKLHANVKSLIETLDAMDEDKTTGFFNEVPADNVPLLSRLLGMDWEYAIEFMKTHPKLDVNMPNTYGPLVLTVVGSPLSVGRMQSSTSFFTKAERLQIATAFVSHPKFDPETLDARQMAAAQAEHFYRGQSTEYSNFMILLEKKRKKAEVAEIGQDRSDMLDNFWRQNAHRLPPRAKLTTGVKKSTEQEAEGPQIDDVGPE